MRFRRLHAVVFGPHRDRDVRFDGRVSLLFGPNESGKSSFRAALETLLYGFEPARRETHPLANWDDRQEEDLQIEAELVFDDGSVQRVERTLQADAKSRIAAEDEEFAGPRRGNTALPIVADVPRKLYQTIYAIELEQLAALEASVQTHVDDLLLPEANSLQLRPLGQIQKQLRAEYERMWRPNRKGNQRARELTEELSEARKRVVAAEQTDAALRAALTEANALEAELAELRSERQRLAQIEADAPYQQALFEHFARVRRLGEPIDLSALEDRPLVDPAQLRHEIETLEQELREPELRLKAEPVLLDARQQAMLAATAEIRRAFTAATHIDRDIRELDDYEARTNAANKAALNALGGALVRTPTAEDVTKLSAIPQTQLRSAQATWAREWENVFEEPDVTVPPLWPVLLAVTGAAVAVGALLMDREVWWVFGGIGASVIGAVAAFYARKKPVAKEVVKPSRPLRVDDLLKGIPVAPSLTGSPTELLRLIDLVTEVQRIAGDARDTRAQAEQRRSEADARADNLRALCERFEIDTQGDPGLLVERLRQEFEGAEALAKRAEADAAQRRQDETEIAARAPTLERKRAHLAALERTLAQAEPGAPSLDEAYRKAVARREERDYVERRQAELSQDPRWNSLRHDPHLTGEVLPTDAPWREEIAGERAERLRACDAALDTGNQRMGELRAMLQEDVGSHAARARDSVLALEEELAQVRRERDRLALLDGILLQAERRFRDEHQPDVLRRASRYLARVTHGRYYRIDYSEEEDGGLRVVCKGRSAPIPVAHPISRGTLDQIFLCLRLGLLDHLDRDREKLPLVLDDALVRMDDARRGQIYSVLGDVALTRQVFLLTCHRALAREAEQALGIERIDLTPGGP